jgi:Sulfotransferase domain
MTVRRDPAPAVAVSEGPPDGAAPPAGSPPPGRAPDFFIVGQPKSGTTALYEMLRSHPQIYMPDGKEPWYFATELQLRPPPRPDGIPATLEEYLRLFDAAGASQRIGEASPLYLWSRTAAGRIAEIQPAARIIMILREPASLLHSLHLQFVKTYVETETDFATALSLEEERRQGRRIPRYTYWPQALLYSDHVRYVEQLRRYEMLFPPEQMLVLIYDEFRRDNEATVRTVLRFLELDDTRSIEVMEANPTVRVRSQQLHHLVHAISVGRGPLSLAAKRAIKTVTPPRLRRKALLATQSHLVYGDPQPPDDRLMADLRRRFKPEVVALSEYLNRDLVTLWGYDELD